MGDVVVINDYRGIVVKTGLRATKLVDITTRDVMVISNSTIKNLVNQSCERSTVMVDIEVDHEVGLVRGEQIIREALPLLPAKHPEIIGVPQYWGVSKLPIKDTFSGRIIGCTMRISFDCMEEDREALTPQVYRELVWAVNM